MFTHMAETMPSCKVSKSSSPVPLQRSPRDLSGVKYEAVFNYTLKEHIDKNNVMGLMVVRDGKILDQHYRHERRETDQFTSFSVAKSMISVLIGIALDEGLIKNLDDPVSRYTSRINESSYSKVSLRSLLRMTDSEGNELGYAFFNATQLDYAKVAVMLANMGEINGKRIVSSEYVDQATNIERQPEGFKFGQAQTATGYGYQFWLREKPGRYFMQGTWSVRGH